MRHFLVHPVLKAKKSFATRPQLFFIELSMFGKCTHLLGCIEVCQEREILMFFHSVPGLRKLINCGFWSKIWKMWFWKILRYFIFFNKSPYKVQSTSPNILWNDFVFLYDSRFDVIGEWAANFLHDKLPFPQF